jgi:hypothetical protein
MRIETNPVEFRFGRFQGLAMLILARGTYHEPSPGHLPIVPSGHDIGPGAQDQVKMVRQDAKAKQVDAKVSREVLKAVFQPLLSMVVVLAGIRIIAHQEASTDTALDDVSNGDFARVEDFAAWSACHGEFSAEGQGHNSTTACSVHM